MSKLLPQEGKWYTTQRGRIIGPIRPLIGALTPSVWFDDYFETGIWDQNGRCQTWTKTWHSYGDLLQEVDEPHNIA